jgi:hypothetical protein
MNDILVIKYIEPDETDPSKTVQKKPTKNYVPVYDEFFEIRLLSIAWETVDRYTTPL